MQNQKIKLNPILKWVGGKRQLLSKIKERLPKKYNKYFELFFGGGALLFDLKPSIAYINDFNNELINVYEVIKNNPNELIEELKKHHNDKTTFYKIRSLDRDFSYDKLTNIQKAARIIYLNKTCYNGLYRVNSQGQLNSPFGKYKNPKICDEELILLISKYFNNNKINFYSNDFSELESKIKKDDFVYLDPPYDPISHTSNFTGYSSNGFNKKDQERLKKFCDSIHKKGAFFMVSNSETDFIKELYKDYKIQIITAKRSINCKGDKRNDINEVLITNYE